MRILHIFDHSIPLQSGYAFRSLSILQQQRAMGWETVHLTSPKHDCPYLPEETVDGWHFYRTRLSPSFADGVPFLRELAIMLSIERRLDAVVAATRPDIIHAHSPVLNAIPALRVARARGVPFVYEVRAFWEDAATSHGTAHEGDLRYTLTRRLESRVFRRADAVTVICEGLRHELLARGIPASKITVIPNAVDLEEFAGSPVPDPALSAKLGFDGKTVLGFLGSFYAYEGLHLLFEAMPEILAAMPETRLLLVGGGPEDGRLRNLAARLGIADKVVFTGRVPHAEVQRYYALVDVLVYPRVPIRLTDLVTPLKPLEAMAQGKIIVASDVGGHRELIRDGATGNMFRAGNVQDLAATTLRVLRDRGSWPMQRANGRRYVEAERSWPASVAGYEPVYRRLMSRETVAPRSIRAGSFLRS